MVPTQQKNIQTVHKGHNKTHDGQVTDHMALAQHDMTACCRISPIQSFLQQSTEKSKGIAPTAVPQAVSCPTAAAIYSCFLHPQAKLGKLLWGTP